MDLQKLGIEQVDLQDYMKEMDASDPKYKAAHDALMESGRLELDYLRFQEQQDAREAEMELRHEEKMAELALEEQKEKNGLIKVYVIAGCTVVATVCTCVSDRLGLIAEAGMKAGKNVLSFFGRIW